ncbi:MAG TPA: CRISPR-associated endonuclease Cas2 [Bacilli bacterium]
MRILLFFDLPTITSQDIKNYTKFRKFLIKEGFIMMQKSVYCKLALNMSVVNSAKAKVLKNSPDAGLVQMLVITEKQYANIEYICGEFQTSKINSADRLIVL